MAYQTFNTNISVIDYKQGTLPWGPKKTSCKGTMASKGYIITSVAIMISYVKCNVTPGELLDNMKNNYNGADCEFVWSVPGPAYGCIYSGKTYGNFNSLKANMFERVYLTGRPTLVRIGSSHTVVVKGFDGTLPVDADGNIGYSSITASMFKINDPGSSSRTTLQEVMNHYGTDITYYNYYESNWN